ncbi:hypothetical protein PIB30_083798, partial [Stylosanthes scabra]|nr:hypothetical protein [Stylosanthes scabra]
MPPLSQLLSPLPPPLAAAALLTSSLQPITSVADCAPSPLPHNNLSLFQRCLHLELLALLLASSHNNFSLSYLPSSSP